MCEKLWQSKRVVCSYLFGSNKKSFVFHCFFRALDVPTSDYTYDDCRLMTRAKELNIPNAADIVEIERLNQKIR